MKVLFKNSEGVKREIAEVKSVNEGYVEIQKFCAERNYEPHYYRTVERDNVLKVDVGSHDEFFYIVKVEETKEDKTLTHLEVIKLLESGKTLVKRNPKHDTYYKMMHGDIYTRRYQHEADPGVKLLINLPKTYWWKENNPNFNGKFEIVED